MEPKYPARWLSPYLYYAAHRRPLLYAEDPTMPFGTATQTIVNEWSDMTDEEKEPFVKSSDLDMVRYQKELQQFQDFKTQNL